jgi:hypothetical protein
VTAPIPAWTMVLRWPEGTGGVQVRWGHSLSAFEWKRVRGKWGSHARGNPEEELGAGLNGGEEQR